MFARRPTAFDLVLLWCALCAWGGACTKKPPPAPPPPPEVTVLDVAPRDVPATFTYVGQTQGVRDVQIYARVEGILLRRIYKEGSRVKAGDPLFEIDPAPFRAAVARAEADLASARARLFKATNDARRVRALISEQAVSRKDYDDALAEERVARAALKGAQADLTSARLELSYTKVNAPIAGLTGDAAQSEGALVTPSRDSLLTTVTQLDPIEITYSPADSERLALERQRAEGRISFPPDGAYDVEVALADGQVHARKGRVDFQSPTVSTQTGTLRSRAVVENPGGVLLPGQFVRVSIKGATYRGAIVVPQQAVAEDQAGKVVMIVDAQNRVQPRKVDVGQWVGEGEWLVTGGIAPGDKVIVDGLARVRPGVEVKVTAVRQGETASREPDEARKSRDAGDAGKAGEAGEAGEVRDSPREPQGAQDTPDTRVNPDSRVE